MNQELIKKAAKKLDELFSFDEYGKKLAEKSPKVWAQFVAKMAGNQLEKYDGLIFTWLLSEAYEQAGEDFHRDLDTVLTAFIDNNPDLIEEGLTDKLVSLIKTSWGDEKEKVVIAALVSIPFGLIELSLAE